MDLPTFFHLLDGILMSAIVVFLGIYLMHRWKIGEHINWGVGKLLNQTSITAWNQTEKLIFIGVFLGISAGIFEEVARYLILKLWAKDGYSWRNGILFGAGHGGAESVILGILVLLAAFRWSPFEMQISRLSFHQTNFFWLKCRLRQTGLLHGITRFWVPLERFFTKPCQITMAVMVMQVYTRRQIPGYF